MKFKKSHRFVSVAALRGTGFGFLAGAVPQNNPVMSWPGMMS
jgi:hypothetical protein